MNVLRHDDVSPQIKWELGADARKRVQEPPTWQVLSEKWLPLETREGQEVRLPGMIPPFAAVAVVISATLF